MYDSNDVKKIGILVVQMTKDTQSSVVNDQNMSVYDKYGSAVVGDFLLRLVNGNLGVEMDNLKIF